MLDRNSDEGENIENRSPGSMYKRTGKDWGVWNVTAGVKRSKRIVYF